MQFRRMRPRVSPAPVNRMLGHDQPGLGAHPQPVRRVFDELAHGRIGKAVGHAVRLHGLAVIARDPGRIERQPDVPLPILNDLLHTRGRQGAVRREVREGELLRGRRPGDQEEEQATPHGAECSARGAKG